MIEPADDPVETLFHRAVELPSEERAAFLDAACGGDPGLRAEVENLLAYDHQPPSAGTLLKSPLVRNPENAPSSDGAGATPPAPGLPGQIGRYRIRRCLGEGGMGIVYEAEQDNPRRPVALKVIRPGLISPALLQRFGQEAQILGRLHHPGIAQVYEAGLAEDGRPFLAMEFIRGLPLDEYAGRHLPGRAARLGLLARVCDAVQHAHDQGIIHRDLKPSNILVDDEGQSKVLDFGVARATDADWQTAGGYTQTGQVLGTPSYMAPEQAEGRHKEVGPAADVYALGAILYELLTGTPPFRAETPMATLRRVIAEEPLPPRRLQPQVPRDLETICLKCLHKQPARRYASAAALADDLKHFLDGKPIQARPAGLLERAGKWARRHPTAAALMLVVSLVALIGFPGVTLLWLDADQARSLAQIRQQQAAEQQRKAELEKRKAELEKRKAEQARDDANHLRRQAERRETRLALDRGLSLCHDGELGPGLLWLARSLELATRTGNPGLERAIRVNLADWSGQINRVERTVRKVGPIHSIAFRPDGKAVLIAANLLAREYDPATGKEIGTPLTTFLDDPFRTVWAVAYSPDGRKALMGKASGAALLWDLKTRKQIGKPLVHGGPDVWAVAFSRDGKLALTAGGSNGVEGTVRFWDSATGQPLGQPLHQKDVICSLAVSRDGQTILTGGWDSTAQLWDAKTRKPVGAPLRTSNKINFVAFSHDGRSVLTCARDGTAQLWDAKTGLPRGDPLRHPDIVNRAAFSPDGRWILITGSDGRARLWNPATRRPVGQVLRHESAVLTAAIHPDGRLAATGAVDGTLRFWQMPRKKNLGPTLLHDDIVHSVAFCGNAKVLATGTPHGVYMWEGGPNRLVGRAGLPLIRSTAFSPTGKLVATAYWYHDIVLWDAANPAAPSFQDPLLQTRDNVNQLLFSHDAQQLFGVLGRANRTVRCWDVRTRQLLKQSLTHPAAVRCLATRPNGRLLATGCSDGTVHLWDLATGKARRPPLAHPDGVRALAWSADGKQLAAGCSDGTVRLWEAARGRSQKTPRLQHPGGVLAAAFSPDGQMLLTGGVDRTARFWDIATGTQLGPALWHQDTVQAVAFAPDGTRCATGSRDKTAEVWEMPAAPAPGAPAQVKLWAEMLAGMELAPNGTVRRLDEKAVAERRRRLTGAGLTPTK